MVLKKGGRFFGESMSKNSVGKLGRKIRRIFTMSKSYGDVWDRFNLKVTN